MSYDEINIPPPGKPAGKNWAAQFEVLRRHINFKDAFAALRYPNYRLWFWSQMFSLFGSWMQSTALGFLIYDLTGSPAYLGFVGFASGLPTWLFMLYAGVIADRVSKRNLIVVTQIALTSLAATVSAMTFLHFIQPWHIIVMAFLLGTANAFEAPSRHAFLLEMVSPEDLTNAIALNSAMFNTATAVGPAVGGLTYALFGPAWCFFINAVSFIPVIAALKMMKLPRTKPQTTGNSPLDEIKEGFSFTLKHPLIKAVIAIIAITTLFGMSFVTLLPAWAVKILHGDAKTNGFLQSAKGIGSLIAALIIALLGRFNFRGKLLTFGSFLLPVLLVIFTFVSWTPLSVLVLTGIGMSLILVFNLSNAIVQTSAPNHIRGRIMSIYALTFFGLMPFGALAIGAFAERFGEKTAILVSAITAFAGMALVACLAPRLKKST